MENNKEKEQSLAMNDNAHCLNVDEVVAQLSTDLTSGLSDEEGERRLAVHGHNKIPTQRQSSALEKLWAQINSVLVYILIAGAVISFVFHHNIDGFVIIGVVVINVSLGYFMENKAENATAVLKGMMSPIAQVLRGGDRKSIDSALLTVGDVFYLQAGDIVPADGRVVRSSELAVLEAPLTGESHPIIKTIIASKDASVPLAERKSMVYSGTQVLKGTAMCVAVGIGAECEIGKISGLLTDIEAVKTPLIVQLERFGLILSIVIVCLALAAFGIAYARGHSVGDGLALAIGIAVAAIPEGLPSCITITFAIGVRFMAGRHAIIKSLPAVETLGSVNVICSDKTGTLTVNKMTVKQVVTAGGTYKLFDDGRIEETTDKPTAASDGDASSTPRKSNGNDASHSEDVLFTHILPGIFCNDGAVLTKDAPHLEPLTPTKAPRSKYGRKMSEYRDRADSHQVGSEDGGNSPHSNYERLELGYDQAGAESPASARGVGNADAFELTIQTEAAAAAEGGFEIQGDPTETCMLSLAVSLCASALKVKKTRKDSERLSEISFDSSTKYMATLHWLDANTVARLRVVGAASMALHPSSVGDAAQQQQQLDGDGEVTANSEGKYKVIFVKGAPEKVLSFCERPAPPVFNNMSMRNIAAVSPFTKFWLDNAAVTASRGMRVLGLAFKVVPVDFDFDGHLPPQCGFTMTSLVGIMDPPRPEAIVAIKVAQRAGITVKMITGDHPITALAIGKMLGLHTSRHRANSDIESQRSADRAITGNELDEYILRNMAEFDQCVAENDVFARTTPEHKIRIVQSLQRQGFVCSMTGDGVNDAPALKAANIGVAMGITGTEVAKDAAVMILTDDNFATIVDAIRIGRCTYNNLVKIITFVLPSNGGQAFSIIGALIIDVAVPITALQILWVNMITSVTLGLVLAFDKPDDEILLQRPRRKNKRLFGRFLTWRLIYGTIILTLAVIGIYQWEDKRVTSIEELRTISVNCLSVAQMGYVFNCRNLRHNTSIYEMVSGNVYLYVGLFSVVVAQVLFTYAPPFQYVFGTRAIDGESWGKIILLAVAVFLAVEAEKYVGTLRSNWYAANPAAKANRNRSASQYTVTGVAVF